MLSSSKAEKMQLTAAKQQGCSVAHFPHGLPAGATCYERFQLMPQANRNHQVLPNIKFRYNNYLYVGGDFSGETNAASSDDTTYPLNYLFEYVGNTAAGSDLAQPLSSDLDDQVSNTVEALYVWRGDLYIGGDFAQAGGVANTAHIVKWNGSQYSSLNDSILNGTVYALGDDVDGNLLLGGHFTNPVKYQPDPTDPTTTYTSFNVAGYDGADWVAYGSDGIVGGDGTANDDSTVYAVGYALGGTVNDEGNRNMVGGDFQSINDCNSSSDTSYFASYMASAGCWVHLEGVGPDVNNAVNTMLSYFDYLYIGGAFTRANTTDSYGAEGDYVASHFAASTYSNSGKHLWETNSNGTLPSIADFAYGPLPGFSDDMNALAMLRDAQNYPYVNIGGAFTSYQNINKIISTYYNSLLSLRVANDGSGKALDVNTYSAFDNLANFSGPVSAMASVGGDFIAGGTLSYRDSLFDAATTVNLVRYNSTGNTWIRMQQDALSGVTFNAINALLVAPSFTLTATN